MLKLNIQLFADGKVVIDTDLDEKGFKQGLDKMQSIASKGFKAIAASVGVVSTALAGLVLKSVNMAGDLEQQIGGTEAVFGDLADTVQKKAAKAFDTMGVSANDFMATANKMGALMQGSGISIEDSMDLSTRAMQRAADVASIMGISMDDAMNSIAGAAKGNFTMMDNLGVAMNATTIEAYAMSKGIKQSYNEMDNATKIGLAMEMFLEKTTYAEGNYRKENETFAGSFTTLKAAMSNFLSGAGGIEDVADALVGFGTILTKSIGDMAPKVIDGLVKLTEKIIPQIPSLLQTLLPTIVNGAISLINGLVTIFPALIQLIKDNAPTIVKGAVLIIKTLAMTILDMLPEILQLGIDIIVELVTGIAESADELIPKIVETIIELFMILTSPDNIQKLIEAAIILVAALIEGIIKSIPKLMQNTDALLKIIITVLSGGQNLMRDIGWQLIKSLLKGLGIDVDKIEKKAKEIINNFKNWLLSGITKIKDVGKELIGGLWQGIQDKWNGLKNKVESLGNGIVKKFKSVFGIKSPSKVMRDQIGKYIAEGIGVGFEDEINNVYRGMQNAIDYENDKLQSHIEGGSVAQNIYSDNTFKFLDNTNNTTQLVVSGKVLAEVVNEENKYREVAKA